MEIEKTLSSNVFRISLEAYANRVATNGSEKSRTNLHTTLKYFGNYQHWLDV